MSIWKAIILGLAQGLGEFLPISSSGHLVLLQTVFNIDEGALLFDTLLHVATLVAVFAVFYKQIWEMIKHPLQKKVYMLVIATAVTAVLAIAFKEFITQAFEGALLGFGFLVTAVILALNELIAHGKRKIDEMKWYQAAGVGLMQGIATLPGISRSGSTIAGSRLFGLDKEDAAEFSFLLSIPAILGSLVLQIPDLASGGASDIGFLPIAAGMLVAGVSGYFAIRWMLQLIKNRRLTGFIIYTAVLGALVLLDQFALNIFFTRPF